jgi:hypothetical protein
VVRTDGRRRPKDLTNLPQYAPVRLFFLPKYTIHPLRMLARVGGQEVGDGEVAVEYCYPALDVGQVMGCKNHRLITRVLDKSYWYDDSERERERERAT